MATGLQSKAGPAFPFGNSIQGVLGNKTLRDSLRSSVLLILTTPKRSIPYNPDLGSFVPYLVFDPLDSATINLIYYYARKDLEEQDPRIKVTSVSVRTDRPNQVAVQVGYKYIKAPDELGQQVTIGFQRGS